MQLRSPLTRPPDFDKFWRETKEELDETPIEWERIPDPDLAFDNRQIDIIRFHSFRDEVIYGWFAPPKLAASGCAGYLWLSGYSLGNPPPAYESIYDGVATLCINLHGNLPDTPYVHPAKTNQEYITKGILNPADYIYRRLVAHCIRAIEILAQQPEVNPECVVVGGMSQGGGLALITAALMHNIRMCFADMPWLCDLDRAVNLVDREKYKHNPNVRPPDSRIKIAEYAEEHPEKSDVIYRSYRYIDPLNHAGNIKCPVQMSAGGRDPSCKPPTIYSVYNEINTEKEILYLPNTGHQIVPQMHQLHSNWLFSKLNCT